MVKYPKFKPKRQNDQMLSGRQSTEEEGEMNIKRENTNSE